MAVAGFEPAADLDADARGCGIRQSSQTRETMPT
jgi:hypothetical protein